MTDRPTCALCGGSIEYAQPLRAPNGGVRAASQVACGTCGTYNITWLFKQMLSSYEEHDRYRLSAITRTASERGEVVELSQETARSLLDATPQPAPVEQMDLLLGYIDRLSGPGRKPVFVSTSEYAVAFAQGPNGLTFLLGSLEQKRLVSSHIKRGDDGGLSPHYVLEIAGYERLEEKQKQPRGPTGWDRVERSLRDAGSNLVVAGTEEQFQAVGLLCRETLISLAQAVHDPSRHPTLDGVKASPTDAKRMLEAYISVELPGETNEEARAHVRAALRLALALQHNRTADFRTSALCAEATTSVVNIVAIIAGKRDK